MGLSKTNIGTTPDGKPLFHVSGEHVVLTGPISGSVTLPDGAKVDVSADVVAVITWNDTSTETSVSGFGVEVLPAA